MIEGLNARDQIALYTFQSFLVEVQQTLTTHVHMLCMPKKNLEIGFRALLVARKNDGLEDS